MRVAIYARVSTGEQDVEKQVQMCREWVERQGHEIYAVYRDVISGSKASRPHFDKLLADMRERRFNAIVVTKLDRLGRSLKHLIGLLDEFKSKGVDFVATTQSIDTTDAAGRLMWQIMGAFAEFERELIRERTREGLANSSKRHLIGKRGKDKKPRKKRGYLDNENAVGHRVGAIPRTNKGGV